MYNFLAPTRLAHIYHRRGIGSVPNILLAFLLVCAGLILLVLGPAKSPRFEDLTEFTCDSPQVLPPSRGGSRSSPGTYRYTCRSDHQVAHFGGLPVSTNVAKWHDCRRARGTVNVWRPALPSPYGGNIFQVACNGEVIVSYEDASASYEANRAFVALLAWCVLGLSAGALALSVIHVLRRR
jgi:hypothetical protein